MDEAQERTWGMLVHLTALSGFVIPFGFIIGPLIVWLIKKEDSDFVEDQGKEALNFQISIVIYAVVASILILVVIGVFLLIAIGILDVIFVIIASVKANSGEKYRYPLTLRLIR